MRGVRLFSNFALSISAVGVLLCSIIGAQAQFGGPKFVKAVAETPKTIEAGKSFTIKVSVTIDKPYHIQANPPKENYIATVLEIGKVKGFKIGKITYPKPLIATIGGETLPIYEGTVQIQAVISPDKTVKPGKFILPVTVNYQGCNEKGCFPPTSIKTEATFTVGKMKSTQPAHTAVVPARG